MDIKKNMYNLCIMSNTIIKNNMKDLMKKYNIKISKITPKSFLKNYVYSDITEKYSKKSKKKLMQSEFEILDYTEYDKLFENNYTVSQLKSISRFFKQRTSGNKKELTFNVYNYLKYSFFSIKIQRVFRGYRIRSFLKLHGPALINRDICVNNQDFLTFSELKSIPYYQFYSFKDKDNFVYGFDLCSVYNMIKDGEYVKNPYNRNDLPKNILKNLKKIIKISKTLDLPLNIKLEDDTDKLSYKKKTELKAMTVFQKFDAMGFITDSNWLMNLSRNRCIRYIRELNDVWNYRAQISNDTKNCILPPSGILFNNINLNNIFSTKTDIYIKNFILDIIEKLITCGVNESSRSLGGFYALGTLTIVSVNASNSLPWLYESFLVNQQ